MSLEPIVSRLAKTVYVVLFRTRPSAQHPRGQLTLLEEPGENKPWSTHNLMIAKHHADLNKGQAATWAEAYSLLLKEYGSIQKFEDELIVRIQAQQEAASVLQAPASDVPGMRAGNDFNDNINRT